MSKIKGNHPSPPYIPPPCLFLKLDDCSFPTQNTGGLLSGDIKDAECQKQLSGWLTCHTKKDEMSER